MRYIIQFPVASKQMESMQTWTRLSIIVLWNDSIHLLHNYTAKNAQWLLPATTELTNSWNYAEFTELRGKNNEK